MKKFVFTTSVSLLCICKAWRVCECGSERIKKLISQSEEKINKLFAGLGLVHLVKNCERGLVNFYYMDLPAGK